MKINNVKRKPHGVMLNNFHTESDKIDKVKLREILKILNSADRIVCSTCKKYTKPHGNPKNKKRYCPSCKKTRHITLGCEPDRSRNKRLAHTIVKTINFEKSLSTRQAKYFLKRKIKKMINSGEFDNYLYYMGKYKDPSMTDLLGFILSKI